MHIQKRCTSTQGDLCNGIHTLFLGRSLILLSVWRKEAGSPRSLASSFLSSAGFFPILLATGFSILLPAPPPPPMTLHPSSLFLLPRNLPARSPPILTQNAVACHYLSCASSELQAHLTCSLFFAPSPYAAIFSRLAAPTQMSQSLLQLNRNLIMRRASPLGKLDERSKSFFDTVSLCRRAGPQIFIRIMWLLYLCVVQVSISSHLAHTCSSLCIKAPKSARHLNYVLLSLCCQSLLKSGVCSLTQREGFRTFSLLAMLFLLHVQAFVCFLTCVAGVPAPEGMNERMTFCCCLTFI